MYLNFGPHVFEIWRQLLESRHQNLKNLSFEREGGEDWVTVGGSPRTWEHFSVSMWAKESCTILHPWTLETRNEP